MTEMPAAATSLLFRGTLRRAVVLSPTTLRTVAAAVRPYATHDAGATPLASEATSQAASQADVEALIKSVSEPPEEVKQHYRSKYADKIKAKLEQANAPSLDDYVRQKQEQDLAGASSQHEKRKAAVLAATASKSSRARAVVALNDILKIDLLEQLTNREIVEIWTRHHIEKGDYVAGGINGTMYATLRERASKCPQFIFPLPKGEGIEMYYFQYNGTQFAFTSLIEYQTHRDTAPAYLVLDLYSELQGSKDVVLFRGQVDDKKLSVQEGQLLVLMMIEFFISNDEKYKLVEIFNKTPGQFDLQKLLDSVNVQV